MNSKVKTMEGEKVGVHFGGKRACWSFGMGTRKIDKQINYSYEPAQTKQQVG